ncbi:DoxX family protein [Tunicatimonas pelagia]|uniref:DoxX family protein n=1 Tax=Tunicatimonas pelagia TaxID=931531 RepID=UPI002666DBF7|nr:DoxX family protein [Tunicatimonas pelagia]WKN41500.1 DoxX family protein [Tunicatimonas pelagia]
MKYLIFNTSENWASTVLRIVLGIIIFIHGIGKLGGEGYSQFIYFFTEYLRMPIILAWLTIAVETIGSLLLIVGFATRINAIALFGLFVGMITFVHWDIGFSMNWWGQLEAGQEGFEYHLLVLAMSGALALLGGGKLSVDLLLFNPQPGAKTL